MVKHPLFGEVSKDFNEVEALKAYELFKTDPEYGHVLLQMHAHERVSEIKYTNPEVIDELIFKKYDERKEFIKDAVLSGVINKSMSNGTVDEIAKAMDSIAMYTAQERAENAKDQRRDVRGRFVPMGKTKIDLPNDPVGNRNPKEWERINATYERVYADRHGNKTIPNVTTQNGKGIRHEFNAKHSAAYLQVADALKQMDPGGLVMAEITYQKHDIKSGKPTGETMKATKLGQTEEEFVPTREVKDGWVPIQYNWFLDGDSTRGGGFDLLTGAGTRNMDAYFAGSEMAGNFPAAAKEYQTKRGENISEYGSTGYNKLSATANMIDQIGGDALSGKAKWALGAAKYVGDNGPEAEKVLGPTARRAAYRYRGVERKPDEKMDRAIMMSVQGAKSIDDARESLLHPTVSAENVGGVYEESVTFSPFIRYWQNQLPKREHLNLHLNSGAIAPSQGVVFDAKGQIVTQAVGYGDDHYLPFNLQNLSRANRGEWVRTRTMGGPTTEDIYAALTTGTRSVTVVSHSGVYNVEFDEAFRGGRRYNDKAARMVRRYSQLLDTLDAENTTLQDVPQDRREEIELKVHREILGDSKEAANARAAKFEELIQAERQEPAPSNAQQEMWKQEFIENFSARQKKWDDNRQEEDAPTWEQMKARESIKAGRELSDDEAIEAIGQQEQFTRFMSKKRKEYKTLQAPLKLNGQGYYFALQALQEQFPYYIKRVEWYPPNDTEGSSVMGTDRGYVQRNYNRPKAAKEGYWANDIEGFQGETGSIRGKEAQTGKIQANYTNYQNYANRQRVNAGIKTGGSGETKPDLKLTPVSGKSPLGIPLSIDAPTSESPHMEQMRQAGIVELARQIAGVSVPFKDPLDQNAQKEMKQIGVGGVGYKRIGNWTETENLLNDEKTRDQTIKDLEDELDSIFSGSGGTDPNSQAIRNAVKGNMLADYNKLVVANRIKKIGTAGAAVSDKSSYFALGDQFMPGRSDEEYKLVLGSDPDIERVVKTRPINEETFPDEFRKAESELLRMDATTDPNMAITYLDKTYQRLDANLLRATMQKDAIGFIKHRQLRRLMKGATKIEPEQESATVSPLFNRDPEPPDPEPTPEGGNVIGFSRAKG